MNWMGRKKKSSHSPNLVNRGVPFRTLYNLIFENNQTNKQTNRDLIKSSNYRFR